MSGKVTLLGAGPGNIELLTLLGKRRLKQADVVLYDRLVNPSLLLLTSQQAQLINVGKMPHYHKYHQKDINNLLVKYAKMGYQVVRLKAGDPYVFGRGGEEAAYLKSQGIAFEVIPGLTSALAGLSAVGIPITQRGLASSFHVITGQRRDSKADLNWNNIAHQEGTLVFLMGMSNLANISHNLIINGKNPHTPVAIIQWATQWRQKMVISNLKEITTAAAQKGLSSPALIVIGEVVKMSHQLNVILPLQKQHILVPFSKHSILYQRLSDLGATVDFYPRQIKVKQKVKLPNLGKFAVILIDSVIAFTDFSQLLLENNLDVRVLAKKQIWVRSNLVAQHLKQYGILVDKVITTDTSINTAQILEIGSDELHSDTLNFLSLEKPLTKMKKLLYDLQTFQAVVFPSRASLKDFIAVLDDSQLQQLQQLQAFVMGEQVANLAQEYDFREIINCPTNLDHTIAIIERKLTNE